MYPTNWYKEGHSKTKKCKGCMFVGGACFGLINPLSYPNDQACDAYEKRV